jgi:hypothetical protein
MKMYRGVEVWLHVFLISEPEEGEWSALCPRCFTPREREKSLSLLEMNPHRPAHKLTKKKGMCVVLFSLTLDTLKAWFLGTGVVLD